MDTVQKPGCGVAANDTDTPMHRMLAVLAGPWTIYLIWVLSNEGPMRFGALRRRIEGISTKMLTERLRLLEAEGFVTRHYEPTVPPQVTYSPTHRIAELLPVLKTFCDLSRKWYSDRSAASGGRPAKDGGAEDTPGTEHGRADDRSRTK